MKFNKKSLIVAGLTLAAVVAAPSVFAVTAAETAVTNAVASGESLMGLVAPGVISIAALMLGVGLAVSWMRK